MKHFAFLGLVLLASCTQQEIVRDHLLCPQTEEGDSDLNLLVGFHNVQENNKSHYYGKILEYIRSVEPFDDFELNVYTIPVNDLECWTNDDKDFVRPQLACDWSVLNERIEACILKNFKMIIITGEEVQTVTVPTYYEQSLSIIHERDFNRYILLHEWGHLFGLQEEVTKLRVVQSSPAWQPRKPNCAESKDQANKWWGNLIGINGTGYYLGCAGHEGYIRPNNETLMGHGFEWSDYGHVSTAYLRQALSCCYDGKEKMNEDSCTEFFEDYPQWTACT